MGAIELVLCSLIGALPILLIKGKKVVKINAFFSLIIVYLALFFIFFSTGVVAPSCPWLDGCFSVVAFAWIFTGIVGIIIEYEDSLGGLSLSVIVPGLLALIVLIIYRAVNGV